MRHSLISGRAAGMLALLVGGIGMTPLSGAAVIEGSDILTIPPHLTGSGNGTLDLRLFTFSGGAIANTAGSFNGDDANNTLPQGNGTLAFSESYVTTAGELKAYYDLNFAPGTIHELVVLLDLNETGGGEPVNTLGKLDIILNPTSISGSPNPTADVPSAVQAAIHQVYTSGTLIANLNPEPAANLPVNSQGAGFADYAIFTGIDVFALNDSDVLLLNLSMSNLNNGAEEVFLSGTYAPNDFPEPVASVMMAIGGMSLLLVRKRVEVDDIKR